MARKQKRANPKARTSTTTKHSSTPPSTRQPEVNKQPESRPLTNLQLTSPQDKQTLHRHILQWQKVAGNKVVAQAIQRQTLSSQQLFALKAPTNTLLQRESSEHDYTTQVTTPISIKVTLGVPGDYSEIVKVATYDDLSRAYDELGSAMFFDRSEFFPDTSDNEYYEAWSKFDDDVRFYTQYYNKEPKTEAPYIAEVNDMKEMMADARKLALKCRQSYLNKEEKFKKSLRDAKEKADEALRDSQKLLRASFLSGEEGNSSTATFLWTMTDHLFTFGGTVADAMDLPFPQALAAGKLIPGAVTLANVVVNWTKKNPMMFGSGFEGLATLNNAVSLAGAANSFFVNPGYLVTAYVGPMLNTIVGMLGKLQMQMIENNDAAADFFGVPLNVAVEPGGKAMWDYMVTAMRASSASDIPAPSGSVFDYFDNFRERFDEFGESKYEGELESYKSGGRDEFPKEPGAIPTESSYWIFTDVNAKKFPAWLFKNRQMVWTLLYGARDPKKAKLTTE